MTADRNLSSLGLPLPPSSPLVSTLSLAPTPQDETTEEMEISKEKTQSFQERAKDATIDLIAGSAGGAMNVYVGQPLDTIKVKMQTFPHMHSGLLQCFKGTVRRHGIRGLYAGTVPALAANIAENSVLFAAYGVCQKTVAWATGFKNAESLPMLHNATAGFLAAFFSSLTLCPTELVKCRLQAMHELAMGGTKGRGSGGGGAKIGPWKLTRQILRSEGPVGLFRGLTSTFSREMPGYFVFFGSYEACREVLTPVGGTKNDLGALSTMFCGGVAGTCLWVCVFPTDVVKSRIQVQGSKEPMIRLMLHISRNEGVMALYKGLVPTVLRTFPATGALFLAYEFTKKTLHSITD